MHHFLVYSTNKICSRTLQDKTKCTHSHTSHTYAFKCSEQKEEEGEGGVNTEAEDSSCRKEAFVEALD